MKLNKLYKRLVRFLDGDRQEKIIHYAKDASYWCKRYMETEANYRQASSDYKALCEQYRCLKAECERNKKFTNIKLLLQDIINEFKELDK